MFWRLLGALERLNVSVLTLECDQMMKELVMVFQENVKV